MTILVADDEPALLRVLQFNFEREGFRVLTAPDGDSAWELLCAHHPEVAVLDAMMPGRTGPEICRAARADPSTARTKLILLSAKGEDDVATLAAECGADRYETKPFSPGALVQRIRDLLGPSGAGPPA